MSPRRKQERKFVQPDTLELAPLCQRRKITETAQPPCTLGPKFVDTFCLKEQEHGNRRKRTTKPPTARGRVQK